MKRSSLLVLCLCAALLLNAQVSKTVNLTTAGTLDSVLTAEEKRTITDLTITGNIDARDFKTMRDEIMWLAKLNLTEAKVLEYIGDNGSGLGSQTYPANTIPTNVFGWNSKLTAISIPNTVTTIEYGAFQECNKLVNCTIPNSVTKIADCAFLNCDLRSVTIPNSVTAIGNGVFNGCSALTTINVDEANTAYASIDGVLYNNSKTTLLLYPQGKTGGITIPNSVTMIGNAAFTQCSDLTFVTIPNSVTTIGDGAFADCSELTSVTIPNSVTTIGGFAFNNCRRLTSVTIPNSVTAIGDCAFANCSDLTSVTISNSVTIIGECFFYKCIRLTSLVIPNSVKQIGESAFRDCSSLTSLTIPNSVTTIEDWAFATCSGLTSVSIPNSVTTIGKFAFYRCRGLTFVTIPNSVTAIGEGAFADCSNLTDLNVDAANTVYSSIDGILYDKAKNNLLKCPQAKTGGVIIPNSVTTIENRAFSDCKGLTSVTIPNSVTTIGYAAFDNCSELVSIYDPQIEPLSIISIVSSPQTTTLYVPFGAKAAYQAAEGWKEFTNILEYDAGLQVSRTSLNLSNTTKASVLISTSSSWTATSNQTWFTISPASGTGFGKITITATPNTTDSTRTAIVTIADGSDIKTITISQTAVQIPNIELSAETVVFTEASTSNIVSVTSNSNWTVACDQTWISFSPVDGVGTGDLSITADSNNTRTQRTATVTLTSSTVTKTISIIQRAPAPRIELSTYTIEFTTTNSATVAVTSDSSWSAFSYQPWWITVSPASGTCSGNLTISAETNPTTEPRTGTIRITIGRIIKTITVTQAAGAVTLTAPTTANLDATGTTTIELAANAAWTAASNQTWLTLSPASGSGSGNLSISTQANPTIEPRTATITVASGDSTKTITITQAAGAVVLSIPATAVIGENGKSTIKVTTNATWSAASDQSWLTITPASGTGDGEITITAEPNTTGAARTATITVQIDEKTKSGSSKTITITQAPTTTAIATTATTTNLLYPNPASSSISIPASEAARVFVYYSTGQLVLSKEIAGKEDVSIEALPAGLYKVCVETAAGVAVYSVVKE